jgi:hypothetical protein
VSDFIIFLQLNQSSHKMKLNLAAGISLAFLAVANFTLKTAMNSVLPTASRGPNTGKTGPITNWRQR